MDLMVGVKIFLKNREGKYLLLRRSARKYTALGGQWDLPGGRINPGAPLLENLQREIREETGLKLTEEPQLIVAQDIIDDSRHVVRLTYKGILEGGVVLNEEHTEFGWFTKQEAEALGDDLDRFAKEILPKV